MIEISRFCVPFKGIGAVLAALAINFLPARVEAELPPIMTMSEIERGMVGEAFTVVDDTGLQSFRVDVVGLMDAGKGSQSMIMAKASGELIDKVGGILQGMSGSPVYIDGRLAGAVSAGIKEMRTSTFFITPIEDMLKLWNLPDTKNRTVSHAIDVKKVQEENRAWREKFFKKDNKQTGASTPTTEGQKAKSAADAKKEPHDNSDKGAATDNAVVTDKKTADDKATNTAKENSKSAKKENAKNKKREKQANKDTAKDKDNKKEHDIPPTVENDVRDKAEKSGGMTFISPRSGWYFSGFTPAAMNFTEERLFPLDEDSSMTIITDRGTDYDAELEPGSPMGVALVYGDFSVGATGTVTAVDNKRILGFGHQFLHKGNVSYFLTDAAVIGTMSGPTAGIKLATIGNIIGRVNQDRSAGVAGELGVFPTVVPVKVRVKDVTLAREDNYSVRIAYDESFLAQLATGVTYAAMAKTADSLESRTATLSFTVRTDAADGGVVTRKNMFYSATDVGQVSVAELAQAINTVCANTDRESNIVDVQVDVSLERGRKTASIIAAVPDKVKVHPGEVVKFTTTIKPWRNDRQTLVIPYTVPKNARPGTLTLDIRGGGLVPVAHLTAALAQAGIDLSPQEDKTIPVSVKLANFADNGRNNEIIIAPGQTSQAAVNPKKALKAAKAAAAKATDEKSKQPAAKKIELLAQKKKNERETRFSTDYIIDNVIHAALQVVK